MKLKKFKYLLSIGASALAIAPIASLAINPTNNAIVKTNVKNNAEGDSGEQSTGETADSSSTLITPVQPADGSIKADTLSPAPNDLYNEYNFESGYVIKDVASGTISFYNWYKQEVWTITVNSDSVTNFPTDKTIGTMNIKGALTQDGTYDTKLFVYGNFSSDSTTTGSYVFEVDMETGKYVDNTLVTNTNPTQSDQNTTTLIGDANLLTVINSNTIIITPKANTTTTNFTYKISFSEITFNSGSDPTVVDYNNVSIDKYTGWYIGEIVGVIETNNQYVFAFKSYDSKNSESFGILEVYFKKSTSGTTTTTLTYTPFNESKSLQNNSVNNNSFDYMPFENSPESLSSSSSSNGISATNNTTYDSKTMEALNSSFNNISVVYSGTIDNPRMLISCNWDSTDLSSNYELSDAAATKVLVTELSKDGSAPTLGTFSVSSSTGRSGVTYLGISNLVSTRNANVGPYAVAVGYGVATAQANTGYDTGSLNRIWFNLVSLNGTLTNTTNSSSNDNGTTYALTSGKWINTFDAYTTNNSTPSNTNKNKIDWQLQFIPNNGTAASGSTDITNYYGYISTGKEQSDKSIAWQENFFQIPKTVTTEGIVDYFLNDYQFGVTNDELTKVYKAIDAATELTTIDKNAFATNATAQSVIDNLYQMYSYTVSDDTSAIVSNWTAGTLDASAKPTVANSTNLKVDETNGTITGSISYDVQNWWNSEKTTITIPVNLQLTKGSDFSIANLASSLTQGTDNKSVQQWLEAKYSYEDLFSDTTTASPQLINFLKDIISNGSLGSNSFNETIRNLLLNSLNATSSTEPATDGIGTGDGQQDQGTQQGKTQSSSAILHSEGVDTNAIKVGNYITVTPDTNAKTATVDFDLSSVTGLSETNAKSSMTFQKFTGTIASDSPDYTSYDSWSGHQSPAEEQNTPQTPTNNSNNSGSSSLSGGAIAGIIIAVLVVIALIIGIYFFVKRRKNIQ